MAYNPYDIGQVIIDEQKIQQRVAELAKQISDDYRDKTEDFVMVGILKGAFIFMADVCRALSIPHLVDFMALSSYGYSGDKGGAVRILMDLRHSIEGKHVLIVEDILDSGSTLAYLKDALHSRGPASLKTCVFIKKDKPAAGNMSIDYLGFEIPDVWVVGYGLDYAEQYRTLPYVAEMIDRDPAEHYRYR